MTNKKPVFVTKDPLYSNCPSCGKPGVLRKSKARKFWEYSLKRFLFFNFYRCRECGWRGKIFTKKIRLSAKQIATFMFSALIFVWAIWRILNNMYN